MKNVKYIIGDDNITNAPLVTFEDEICNFLEELSKEIIKSTQSKRYPDLYSFGFWCRKSNIQRLKEKYSNPKNRLGRGLCFHIAPSNIPINFAFSYIFSLLAGNSNIVRLPSKDFEQVNILTNIIKNTIENYEEIKSRTAFIKYGRDNEITQKYSSIADARMIWGGDKTIQIVRQMNTKPRCIDISFSDRYSICIINGTAIENSSEQQLQRLAIDFYNDTYLMDQNACSSPQLIYWINDSTKARQIFWNYVYQIATKKYQLQDSICVDKYTKLCEDSLDYSNIQTVTFKDNLLYRTELTSINTDVETMRGKGGYFYEYSLKDLNELYSIINERYQTITYFGIDANDLAQNIIKYRARGVDRIVPIGKAMDINILWDGHDLITELSREIDVN